MIQAKLGDMNEMDDAQRFAQHDENFAVGLEVPESDMNMVDGDINDSGIGNHIGVINEGG